MTRDADEDAFRWDGDEDPETSRPRAPRRGKSRADSDADDARTRSHNPRPRNPDSQASEVAAQESAEAAAEGEKQQQMSSALLVVLGVLGGIYLLYTVGWALTAVRHAAAVSQGGMQLAGEVERWMATIASPLWFVVVLYLSRGHRTARVIWLVVGALVLAPWPFIMGGI